MTALPGAAAGRHGKAAAAADRPMVAEAENLPEVAVVAEKGGGAGFQLERSEAAQRNRLQEAVQQCCTASDLPPRWLQGGLR